MLQLLLLRRLIKNYSYSFDTISIVTVTQTIIKVKCYCNCFDKYWLLLLLTPLWKLKVTATPLTQYNCYCYSDYYKIKSYSNCFDKYWQLLLKLLGWFNGTCCCFPDYYDNHMLQLLLLRRLNVTATLLTQYQLLLLLRLLWK